MLDHLPLVNDCGSLKIEMLLAVLIVIFSIEGRLCFDYGFNDKSCKTLNPVQLHVEGQPVVLKQTSVVPNSFRILLSSNEYHGNKTIKVMIESEFNFKFLIQIRSLIDNKTIGSFVKRKENRTKNLCDYATASGILRQPRLTLYWQAPCFPTGILQVIGSFIYSDNHWIIINGPKIYEETNVGLVRKLRSSDYYNYYSYTEDGERCNTDPCDYFLKYEIKNKRIASFTLDSPLKPFSYIGVVFTKDKTKPLNEMTKFICMFFKETNVRAQSYISINDELFLDRTKGFINQQCNNFLNKRLIVAFDISLKDEKIDEDLDSHSIIYFLYVWGDVDSNINAIFPKKENIEDSFEKLIYSDNPSSDSSVCSEILPAVFIWFLPVLISLFCQNN